MLRNMFKKTYTMIDTHHRKGKSEEEPNIPEGLWKKCNKCGQPIYVEAVRLPEMRRILPCACVPPD